MTIVRSLFYRYLFRAVVFSIIVSAIAGCSTDKSEYSLVIENLTSSRRQIYVADADEFSLKRAAETSRGEWIWVSPNGEYLASLTRGAPDPEGTLSIISLSTGETITTLENVGQFRFELIPYDENVVWSPDGTALAYLTASSEGNGTDISIYDLTARTVTRITDDEALQRSPAWSADGSMLAFAMLQPCGASAWDCPLDEAFWTIEVFENSSQHTVVDMEDTGSQRAGNLHYTERMLCNLSWSPDNAYILFEDGCDPLWPALYKELFVASVHPAGVWQLTDFWDEQIGLTELGYETSWQAGGDILLIAYSKLPFGPPDPDQVSLAGMLEISTDGFVTTNDLPGPDGFVAGSASWSPDGRYLAWLQSTPERLTVVAEVKDDQLAILDISANLPGGGCDTPRWSPDGQYLAYTISSEYPSSQVCMSDTERTVVVISIPDGHVFDITESLEGNNRIIGWIPLAKPQ